MINKQLSLFTEWKTLNVGLYALYCGKFGMLIMLKSNMDCIFGGKKIQNAVTIYPFIECDIGRIRLVILFHILLLSTSWTNDGSFNIYFYLSLLNTPPCVISRKGHSIFYFIQLYNFV